MVLQSQRLLLNHENPPMLYQNSKSSHVVWDPSCSIFKRCSWIHNDRNCIQRDLLARGWHLLPLPALIEKTLLGEEQGFISCTTTEYQAKEACCSALFWRNRLDAVCRTQETQAVTCRLAGAHGFLSPGVCYQIQNLISIYGCESYRDYREEALRWLTCDAG